MIRGTTPTFRLTIKDDVDLSLADHVYVSFKQGRTNVELTGNELEIDGNIVACRLTQEKSLQLVEGEKAKIQINWTYPPDETGFVARPATETKEITIGEQLIRRVLP